MKSLLYIYFFLGLRIIMTTEERLCWSSAIFVCCNDGGGGKDASQRGCWGRKCSFFSPGFCGAKPPTLPCFCFLLLYGLCAAEAPSSLPDESLVFVLSHSDHGGRCLGLLSARDHRVLLLTSARDIVGCAMRSHGM